MPKIDSVPSVDAVSAHLGSTQFIAGGAELQQQLSVHEGGVTPVTRSCGGKSEGGASTLARSTPTQSTSLAWEADHVDAVNVVIQAAKKQRVGGERKIGPGVRATSPLVGGLSGEYPDRVLSIFNAYVADTEDFNIFMNFEGERWLQTSATYDTGAALPMVKPDLVPYMVDQSASQRGVVFGGSASALRCGTTGTLKLYLLRCRDDASPAEQDRLYQSTRGFDPAVDLVPSHSYKARTKRNTRGAVSLDLPFDSFDSLQRNLFSMKVPYEELGYGTYIPPRQGFPGAVTGIFKDGGIFQGAVSDVGTSRPELAANGYPYEVPFRYSEDTHEWLIDFIVAANDATARRVLRMRQQANEVAAHVSSVAVEEQAPICNTVADVYSALRSLPFQRGVSSESRGLFVFARDGDREFAVDLAQLPDRGAFDELGGDSRFFECETAAQPTVFPIAMAKPSLPALHLSMVELFEDAMPAVHAADGDFVVSSQGVSSGMVSTAVSAPLKSSTNLTMKQRQWQNLNDFVACIRRAELSSVDSVTGAAYSVFNDSESSIEDWLVEFICAEAAYDSSNKWDVKDAKAQYGFAIHLFDGPVIWTSKKHSHVGTSSTHNEYMALYWLVRSVVWLRQLIAEIGLDAELLPGPISCRGDNAQATNLCCDDIVTSGNKFYNMMYHFSKECYEAKLISPIQVDTSLNWVDILTKCVDATLMRRHAPVLTGYSDRRMENLVDTVVRD